MLFSQCKKTKATAIPFKYDEATQETIVSLLHDLYDCGITYLHVKSDQSAKYKGLMHRFSEDFDDTLSQLFIYITELFRGDVFACIVNTINERNATAKRLEEVPHVPIIEIYLPLIAEVVALSHSFSLYKNYLNYTGGILDRYDYRYFEPIIRESGSIEMIRANTVRDKMLSNIRAYLSTKWILLHESAHHQLKHLNKLDVKSLKERGNDFSERGLENQKFEVEADIWATLRLLSEFDQIKEYIRKFYFKKATELQCIKIIYMAILTPLLIIDERITGDNMTLVDHPPSLVRQTSISNAFVAFFCKNDSNNYWCLIKDELMNIYEKTPSLLIEAEDDLGRNINLSDAINNNDPEITSMLFRTWILEALAWVLFYYYDMKGGDYLEMISKNESVAKRAKQLYDEDNKIFGVYEFDGKI
jgi:hypothetical protein